MSCSLAPKRKAGHLARLTAVLVVSLIACALPQAASAKQGVSKQGVSLKPSKTKPYYACPHGGCELIVDPPAVKTAHGYALPDGTRLVGGGIDGGYTAEELESAYGIPKTGGRTPEQQTVAVIEAYSDTEANGDLDKYRERADLSPCTEETKCLKKVNQKGEEKNYPPEAKTSEEKKAEEEWGMETSADLDMVSAACPECHILLVEANNGEESEMGAAVKTAVELGATEVSLSYGYPETYEAKCGKTDCSQYASDYEHSEYDGHPVVILAGAGDWGYDSHWYPKPISKPAPMFPASAPTVIAVGGTELNLAGDSRSSEKVWNEPLRELATDSGCSEAESKPAWQKDAGCVKHRTDDDVAADAACETPVAVYSAAGWGHYCGTSVATPFIAGVEAHATAYTRSLGADAFYKRPEMLFHVSEGDNGECGALESKTWYLCNAVLEGYSGPVGWGTPDGVPEVPTAPVVTTEPATGSTETEATLHGTVDPEGSETKYYFEYGPTTAYGTKTAEVSVGSGTSGLAESQAITGLTAATKYHFRMVATNGIGTTDGKDLTLTTHPLWVAQEPPNPTGAQSSSLSGGLSCGSSSSCFAGGSSYSVATEENKLVIEDWSGTAWSLQEPPAPAISKHDALYLTGISCTSASACVAVGYFTNGSGVEVPLSESWNGTSWSLSEPPTPAGATRTVLEGVSCTSSTACVAAGFDIDAGKFAALAEAWNGTSWSQAEPPAPAGSSGSILFGVSCTSGSACTAVGVFGNSAGKEVPLAERWNGTTWSAQEPAGSTGASETELAGVSCTSATACQAVGVFRTTSTSADAPFAESWNGTTWTVQTVPKPAGVTGHVGLQGVSCTSATVCVAVGSFADAGKEMPLAERWNGTAWSLEEPPIPTGAGAGTLSGVSCTSSTACFAGGKAGVGTLAEDYH